MLFVVRPAALPPPATPPAAAPPAAAEAAPAPEEQTPAPAFVELDWSWIESSDPAQLMAHLRIARCPERTIADIVRSRVQQDFQRRINQAANPLLKYWGSPAELKEADQKKRTLAGERDALLTSLGLHTQSELARAIPKAAPTRTEQLAPEKLRSIAEITARHPNIPPTIGTMDEDWDSIVETRRARIDYLKGILTPEELFYYRIERDSHARMIFAAVRDLPLTEDELRRVCFAADFINPARVNGLLGSEAEQVIREVLGSERYATYLEIHSPKNVMFEIYVAESRLGTEAANALRAIRSRSLDATGYQAAVAGVLGEDRVADYMRRVHRD
jgi:hypothetical protein